MSDESPEGAEPQVEVVIAVDDDALDNLDDIVAQLRSRGLEVIDVQSALGTISGHIPRSSLSTLSAVTGVESLEETRVFQLPPPDSGLQGRPS